MFLGKYNVEKASLLGESVRPNDAAWQRVKVHARCNNPSSHSYDVTGTDSDAEDQIRPSSNGIGRQHDSRRTSSRQDFGTKPRIDSRTEETLTRSLCSGRSHRLVVVAWDWTRTRFKARLDTAHEHFKFTV